VHVLSSREGFGPGSRVIAAFETDEGRRLLVDRGFCPRARARPIWPRIASRSAATSTGRATADSYTPSPTWTRNLWFSREVGALPRIWAPSR
jgi:surfeit locus 1 family protein